MCDSITPKRKPKWNTPHSTITIEDAGDRLGFRVITPEGLEAPVRNFLKDTGCLRGAEDTLLKTKQRVYKRIQDHLVAKGYPSEAGLDFKEANINDLVYVTIVPIIADFSTRTRDALALHGRSRPVATDPSAGVVGDSSWWIGSPQCSQKSSPSLLEAGQAGPWAVARHFRVSGHPTPDSRRDGQTVGRGVSDTADSNNYPQSLMPLPRRPLYYATKTCFS